ncbi:hypothetical protein DID78_04810 [Candidatus Marinamargulisbacteria bacterium SCGC AG-343-D04]|nr:hypothetical protein DID78_04810 [Candidatus Marinamargulisbacteria bacterium SCGC AG-343-D04]
MQCCKGKTSPPPSPVTQRRASAPTRPIQAWADTPLQRTTPPTRTPRSVHNRENRPATLQLTDYIPGMVSHTPDVGSPDSPTLRLFSFEESTSQNVIRPRPKTDTSSSHLYATSPPRFMLPTTTSGRTPSARHSNLRFDSTHNMRQPLIQTTPEPVLAQASFPPNHTTSSGRAPSARHSNVCFDTTYNIGQPPTRTSPDLVLAQASFTPNHTTSSGRTPSTRTTPKLVLGPASFNSDNESLYQNTNNTPSAHPYDVGNGDTIHGTARQPYASYDLPEQSEPSITDTSLLPPPAPTLTSALDPTYELHSTTQPEYENTSGRRTLDFYTLPPPAFNLNESYDEDNFLLVPTRPSRPTQTFPSVHGAPTNGEDPMYEQPVSPHATAETHPSSPTYEVLDDRIVFEGRLKTLGEETGPEKKERQYESLRKSPMAPVAANRQKFMDRRRSEQSVDFDPSASQDLLDVLRRDNGDNDGPPLDLFGVSGHFQHSMV